MRHKSRRIAILILLSLASVGVPSSHANDLNFNELPNFHKVNEHLYRGGQPGKGGMKKLAELGIKTILNLRGEEDLSRQETSEASKAGLKYFAIPMAGVGRPTDNQISRALTIIDTKDNWPVFVHCKHGSDRTGTVMACYHILHDGWKSDRAVSEARQFGMSWVEFGMRDYISHFNPTAAIFAVVKGTEAAVAKGAEAAVKGIEAAVKGAGAAAKGTDPAVKPTGGAAKSTDAAASKPASPGAAAQP